MHVADALPSAVPTPPGASVLVAVSGGPDSTALLRWLAAGEARLVAAHYDHALRAGSEDDAAHVAGLCARLGLPLHVERRARALAPGSVQAAARELRYDFLERARAAAGCDVIATAHTADDVVEGVLLHLLRGSGLAGLRGVPARRGRVVRPFLGVWRRDIEAWLRELGERPVRDPSNAAVDRFARARVRALVVPALERERPGLALRVHRVAMRAAAWQERLEADARALGDGRARLQAAPAPLRAEAYRRLYGASPALGRRHLAALDRLVMEGRTGDGVDLPGRRRARLEPARLAIVDAGPGASPARPLPALAVRSCAGCDGEGALHLDPRVDVRDLRVARRTPGLSLRAAAGRRKLQDVLVDAKVPRHERDDLPLVFAGDRLVWVPGVAADAELALPPGRAGIHLSLHPGFVWKKEGMVVSASPTTRRPHL